MAEGERARAACRRKLAAAQASPPPARASLQGSHTQTWRIPEILAEVTEASASAGIQFPGSRRNPRRTRSRQRVRRQKSRPLQAGHARHRVYNPMRILLGSIALVDDGTPSASQSDYVVRRGSKAVCIRRGFISGSARPAGAEFIYRSRAAPSASVLLFNRLAKVK